MKEKSVNNPIISTITIDYREKYSKIPSILELGNEFHITFSKLKAGDYLINQEVCIERKTAKDFIASIIDGRLFMQAKKLRSTGLRVLLLIEGDPFAIKNNMNNEAIRGAMLSISVSWQIPIIFSNDAQDLAAIIRMLSHQHGTNFKPIQRMGYLPKRLSGKKLYFLQGLPGVGTQSAKLLLNHFETLLDVLKASREELMSIPGFGKKKSERIYQFLRTNGY